jgi:hypothetical protein
MRAKHSSSLGVLRPAAVVLAAALGLGGILVARSYAEQSAAAAPTASPDAATAAPVVVELFTSQGCSSCPPADRLLTRMMRDPKLASEVIPLAFHVDYWDHQGWNDPFSSHGWTERQEAYAKAFHADRVYTPQLVVSGRSQCNGAMEGDVRQNIDSALAVMPAGVVSLADVAVTTAPTKSADGSAHIKVSARLTRPGPSGGVDVWVALTQNGLTTEVRGGENAKATLHDDHVVRQMVKALTLPASPGPDRTAEVDLALPRGASVDAFQVAAFLQDPASLIIAGGAERSLTSH